MDFKIYVRGIILNETKDKVLLIKKNKEQKIGGGSWLLPGGTLEFNEDTELSLKREIKEETNLDITDLSLITSKKMIIGQTHWLGLYYIVNIEKESNLKNIESDKHDSVRFVDLKEVPTLKDYSVLQFVKGLEGNQEFFDAKAVDSSEHAMEEALDRYVFFKIHHLLRENADMYTRIKVIGNYDRSIHVSKDEKQDKPFNYKRPTLYADSDTLYLCCFPAIDYVYHYAKLVATYVKSKDLNIEVSYMLPSQHSIDKAYNNTNLSEVPEADVIIFGNVDKLDIFDDKSFEGTGSFKWKQGLIGDTKVTLLGCEFSVWGSGGYDLVTKLKEYSKCKTFIYVGKLGSLSHNVLPNSKLASGGKSFVNGKKIEWDSIFDESSSSKIQIGTHVTCASVLDETKDMLQTYIDTGDFIDPEIGNMAKACNENGIRFSYLHIISDNVVKHNIEENLSNERKEVILEKRKSLFSEISSIINQTFA